MLVPKRQARLFATCLFTQSLQPYVSLLKCFFNCTLIAVNFSLNSSSSNSFGFLTVPRVRLAPQACRSISEKACTMTASIVACPDEKYLQASLPSFRRSYQAAVQVNKEGHWSSSMNKSRNQKLDVALSISLPSPRLPWHLPWVSSTRFFHNVLLKNFLVPPSGPRASSLFPLLCIFCKLTCEK